MSDMRADVGEGSRPIRLFISGGATVSTGLLSGTELRAEDVRYLAKHRANK